MKTMNTVCMVELAFTVPILPGKRTALEELAKTVSGSKKKEYDNSEKKLRIAKETWFVESSPQGDVWILYAEGKDLAKSFDGWVASKDSFDLWFKGQMKEITGIDFSNPPPGDLPKQLLRYRY
jgi:hypothetical protein